MPREKRDWTLMEFLYTAAKVSYEFEHRVTYSSIKSHMGIDFL
jgi:hypothetical protein